MTIETMRRRGSPAGGGAVSSAGSGGGLQRAKIPLMATAAALAYPTYPHISEDPQVMSGSPCIAGTRVRVMDLVSAYKAGVPVDELQEYFSSRTLTLSEIYAALAYYFDHQEALEAASAEEQELGLQAERQSR